MLSILIILIGASFSRSYSSYWYGLVWFGLVVEWFNSDPSPSISTRIYIYLYSPIRLTTNQYRSLVYITYNINRLFKFSNSYKAPIQICLYIQLIWLEEKEKSICLYCTRHTLFTTSAYFESDCLHFNARTHYVCAYIFVRITEFQNLHKWKKTKRIK